MAVRSRYRAQLLPGHLLPVNRSAREMLVGVIRICYGATIFPLPVLSIKEWEINLLYLYGSHTCTRLTVLPKDNLILLSTRDNALPVCSSRFLSRKNGVRFSPPLG